MGLSDNYTQDEINAGGVLYLARYSTATAGDWASLEGSNYAEADAWCRWAGLSEVDRVGTCEFVVARYAKHRGSGVHGDPLSLWSRLSCRDWMLWASLYQAPDDDRASTEAAWGAHIRAAHPGAVGRDGQLLVHYTMQPIESIVPHMPGTQRAR